jgi:hypothetical protein
VEAGIMPVIRISPRLIVCCALYAAAMVIYTDYLTARTAGSFISYAAVSAVLLTALFNYRAGTLGALLLLFTFPAFPRDLLDLYESLDHTGTGLMFSSPKFLTLGGFTLVIWMFAGLALLAVCRGVARGFRFEEPHTRRMFWFAFAFVALLVSSAALAALNQRPIALKEIVSDLRFPFMLAFGAMIGGEFVASSKGPRAAENHLVRLLIALTLISGFKVLFFVADDRLSGSHFRLSFCNPFVIIFPVLLALLWLGRGLQTSRGTVATLTTFGLAASVPDGRGPILIDGAAFLLLFLLAAICRRSKLPALALRGAGLLGAIAVLLIGISASDPRLWKFLAYKSEFLHSKTFYAQLEHSPAVRIAEMRNVWSQNAGKGFAVLIGGGAGASFTYKDYPLRTSLGRSDYSAPELASGLYYHPHVFATYWFLKGGLVAVCSYVGIFWWMGSMAMRRMRLCDGLFPAFMVLLAPAAVIESFWQPDLTLALAVFLAVLAGSASPSKTEISS